MGVVHVHYVLLPTKFKSKVTDGEGYFVRKHRNFILDCTLLFRVK